MKYLVVFEKTAQSFGAYVPDLPGCVAAANSHEEVCLLIQEAIDLHLQDLQARGLPLPPPNSVAQQDEISH
jgi:predicted RNase H-like HicB family nuclease